MAPQHGFELQFTAQAGAPGKLSYLESRASSHPQILARNPVFSTASLMRMCILESEYAL
jgi:hypothetical protein